MTEFYVINGHAPWCSYIRTLEDLEDEEPCDCGWDDHEADCVCEDCDPYEDEESR